jgi:GT2 family glycosyltransferase
VEQVRDFAAIFTAAYNQPCDILSLMAGNFAIKRQVFLRIGGMDENFQGPCYRLETELSYRLFRSTRRKVRFFPDASLRHLHAAGGTRAFGHKDTWRHIGGSLGDYYFAWRCLPLLAALRYSLRRMFREPLNRQTVRRPWRIPSLFLREIVALGRAVGRIWRRPNNYIKDAGRYEVLEQGRQMPVDAV